MKFFIIVSSMLVMVAAQPAHTDTCGVYIQGTHYDKQILAQTNYIFALAMDYVTDTMFFCYFDNQYHFKFAAKNLKTSEVTSYSIDIDIHVYALAVDSKSRSLYAGTIYGLYVYHIDTNQTQFLGDIDHTFSTLFLKDDVLYYTDHHENLLRTYSNGEYMMFNDLQNIRVMHFVLDDANNFIVSNGSVLFKQHIGSDVAVPFKGIPEHVNYSDLTLDMNGNIYTVTSEGVYFVKKDDVNKDDVTMERILEYTDVEKLIVDGDNHIIYSTGGTIVRLVPSGNKTCEMGQDDLLEQN